jgi:hypothetical protein
MTQEKNKKQTALDLLDMIIEKAYLEDGEHKKKMIARHKGSKAVGISWMCFHLEILKGILKEGD